MRRAVLALFCLLALTGTLHAATFEAITDARLIGRAELVVVATVEHAAARQVDRVILTDYSLRVEQVLRGHAPAGVLTVTELGGHAGGLLMIVSGSASYTPGSRVMAFLRARGDGTYFTAFMSNGAMRFARGAGGREIVIRTNDEAMTASPADELIEYVRGDRAVAPMAVPYHEEDHPSISASASQYTTFGGSPSRPVRWPGCNVNCTIQFVINGTQPVPDSAGGVAAAMGAWTGDPDSFVKLQLTGTTAITQAAQDNVNTILLDNANPAPLAVCDGAIACGVAYANNTHNFDGDTFYSAFEADVVYRPGAASQNAFAAILTHEFGHGLAFRHANGGTPSSTSAIMSSPTPTSQGATLRDWDKEALAEVYGAGVVCVPPDITGVAGGGTVNYSSRTTLSATITGSSPRTHQWYEGTAPDTSTPVGSNQPTFQTPSITTERKYWLKVTNECGEDVSSTITVTPTECDDARITTDPLSQRIQPSQTATLEVVAIGTAPLKYDWYEGERGTTTKKVGTNSPQFKTPALTANTTYWVRVTNLCGDDDSAAAVITVGTHCVQPTISQQPAGAEVTVGSKALLQVSAAGDAPIAFQWYEGEAPDATKPIAGATSAAYEPGPFTAAGTFKYWAKATNACGSANSNTATITATCTAPVTPAITVPPISPRALGYEVSWNASLASTHTFELQEADNPSFAGAKTFAVDGALKLAIQAHTEITADTRFYYRVRAFSACNGEATGYSGVSNTLVTVPPPPDSSEFVVGIPDGTSEPFTQDYLVPGFGETATNNDTFSIASTVPWITVFPPSGALSAGGTTVQLTINPAGLGSGSVTGTLNVTRVNAAAARGGIATHDGTTTAVVPFSLSLVTPVSPTPRDTTPPAGTLLIPAIAHADGIGTRFQSDIRIANAASEAITYDISFTPSASNGTSTGKKTTMVIASNETKGLDDVVKIWFGAGVAGEAGLGTLEIRPLKLAGGGIPNPLSTFASSRTYAISSTGTLGQFIPALPLSGFIGDFAKDSLARISLQQVAHNDRYRTNFGIAEGSGSPANVLVKLLDANNNLVKSVPLSLTAYEHQQLRFDSVFGSGVTIADGRIEVEVTSATGKVTAYASVIDNDTADPLLVFPVQAGKLSSARYVVPGVAELNTGSNFHTDMRIYNPGTTPVSLTLSYKPQRGDSTPIPSAVTRTVDAGQVLSIDNVLPALWSLNASGGAVTVTAPNAAPLVVTARTYSREADGGTYGQFIPAVTSTDAVGLGERALEVLQLEDSGNRAQLTGFRSNLGLVEVTGNRAVVELTLRPPDSKLTAVAHVELAGGEFVQLPQVFRWAGFGDVYNGRVSVRVVDGLGRVAGYGSVVDNRTEDPTYVPSQ